MTTEKTITITGANGMFGAHLVLEALKKGYHVNALSRNPWPENNFLSQLLAFYNGPKTKLTLLEVDYFDLPSLHNIISESTYVIHNAGLVEFNNHQKLSLFRANQKFTEHIVNQCIDTNLDGFLYVSSIAAQGYSGKGNFRWGETFWRNAYGYSKFLAELEIHRGGHEGLKFGIARPGVIIGASPNSHPGSDLLEQKLFGKVMYTKGGSGFISAREAAKHCLEMVSDCQENTKTLVEKNYSYRELAMLKQEKMNNSGLIKINKFLVYIAYLFTNTFYHLRLSRKSIPKSMIKGLFELSEYECLDGVNYSVAEAVSESLKFSGKGNSK